MTKRELIVALHECRAPYDSEVVYYDSDYGKITVIGVTPNDDGEVELKSGQY